MRNDAVLIADSAGSEAGLICGFRISRARAARDVHVREIADLVPAADEVIWLHFNLANARARQLIAQAPFVPQALRDVFCEHDARRCVVPLAPGVLAVISDLTFESDSDPAEVAPLWSYFTEGFFITGRIHPLKTVDELRAAVRGGLSVAEPVALLVWILTQRTAALRHLTAQLSDQVGDTEDEILRGRIRQQREQLGRIRRLCAQLRRHFSPDRLAFRRLLQQAPPVLGAEGAESIRAEVEELSYLIDEFNELYERAKLLQEELASRVAESTGRNLYVLAILTAVFLPMTLITGVFGMNIAGLPGLHDPGAFWWVMLLIGAGGAATLAAIFWRRGP